MGRIFKNLIIYTLVVYFVLTIYEGITIPTNYIYLIATFIIFSLSVFISSALLNFLTIKENFITTLLMTSILSMGVFFLMEAFMPGFGIEEYTFEGLDTGSLVISTFEVTKVITMVVGSITFAFITSMINVLEKSV